MHDEKPTPESLASYNRLVKTCGLMLAGLIVIAIIFALAS